ncbi:MAG: Gfo/Idh/MocA family oxidoreductase [Clostridia bacterium]|nr:Gfo/Idh/MocA family oxidoreductase [Clostridia bacterium]
MKLKILFNGFRHGHIEGLYQRVASSDIAEVAGCIEPHGEARRAAEKKLGATFSEKTYEEWLKTDIDAVAIGNAYGERGQMILKALRAGKHVIADKPICTSPKELEEIASISREKNRKIACMLDLRYLPQTVKACEILHSGVLGEIRNVAFNGQHPLAYGTRPTWYFEKGMHGGTINDLAIHGVDLVRMLTRREFTSIDAARVWNSYAYKDKDFKDCALFMARLEGGAGVIADVSYSAPSPSAFCLPSYWEFRIWCEKGLLTFNWAEAAVTVYAEGQTEPIKYTELTIGGDYLSEFAKEIQNNTRDMTENILASSHMALTLQAHADNEVLL